MGERQSTTKVEIPEASPQEQELQNFLIQDILPTILESSGIDVQTEEVLADPAGIKELEVRIQQEKDSIRGSLIQAGVSEEEANRIVESSSSLSDAARNQDLPPEARRVLTSRNFIGLSNDEKELREKQSETVTRFSGRKKEDPRIEQAISRFGEGSEQVQRLRRQQQEKEIKAAERKEEFDKLLMDNAIKIARGDLSISPEQSQFLKDSFESVRKPVEQALDEIGSEISRTEQSVSSALDGFISRVKQTDEDVGSALNKLDERISQTGESVGQALDNLEETTRQTGQSTKEALEESIAAGRVVARRNLENFSEDFQKRIADQAASVGRSATDPRFQRQFLERTLREVGDVESRLGASEAAQRAGLEERTGVRLEDIDRARAQLEESTGRRREDVQGRRVGLAERTGGRLEEGELTRAELVREVGLRREGLAGQRAQFTRDIESGRQSAELQLGQGQPITAIRTGLDVAGLQSALDATRRANLGFAQGSVTQPISALRGERLAQPTQTTTTRPSGLDIFGGLVDLGTSIGGLGFDISQSRRNV